MYSVVLMVALTGGGDVPAGLFSHGCCGGGGHQSSCYGCNGGCYGGGHKHHRSHGCCGGNNSCYGGSCYGGNGGGCFGGGHKHHRGHGCCGGNNSCYGGGCYGSNYGGTVGYGCVGTPVMPVAPVPAMGMSRLDNVAPATLIVSVPVDARLSIDGAATPSISTQRVFVSPALSFGREYHYTLQAEFVQEGKVVTVSKEVAVKAGDETQVRFDAGSVATVASR